MSVKTRPAPNIPEKLAEARREADELARQLAQAEADVALAVEEQRFADAEQAKARADGIRPHAALAQATVSALKQAADELDAHRREAERAEQERLQREQADAQHQDAKARRDAAQEDVQRLLAEIPAALDAVRAVIQEALMAEERLRNAQGDWHTSGIAAGHIDPTSPAPYPAQNVRARVERSQLLNAIYRNREL